MVAEGNTDHKPLLLEYEGKLYDVASFAAKHPGGSKVLREVSGGDATEYIKGQKRILGVMHEHSNSALEMLKRYSVESMQKGDPLLDDKKGVLGRIGGLGDKYWTWIHQPYEGTIRLFDSRFLESLTRTAWWVVPAVWCPLVAVFSYFAMEEFRARYGLQLAALYWAILFSVGILAWTLLEYMLHRYVFHWHPDPKSPNQLVFHFLAHGLHHKTPMDGDRLVFPPVPAAMIISVFYLIYSNSLDWPVFCAFGAGKLFGYVGYDMIHYYLHHGSPEPHTNMHFKKVYHHNHHFKNFDVAFGISTQIWDHVFSTVGLGPL